MFQEVQLKERVSHVPMRKKKRTKDRYSGHMYPMFYTTSKSARKPIKLKPIPLKKEALPNFTVLDELKQHRNHVFKTKPSVDNTQARVKQFRKSKQINQKHKMSENRYRFRSCSDLTSIQYQAYNIFHKNHKQHRTRYHPQQPRSNSHYYKKQKPHIPKLRPLPMVPVEPSCIKKLKAPKPLPFDAEPNMFKKIKPMPPRINHLKPIKIPYPKLSIKRSARRDSKETKANNEMEAMQMEIDIKHKELKKRASFEVKKFEYSPHSEEMKLRMQKTKKHFLFIEEAVQAHRTCALLLAPIQRKRYHKLVESQCILGMDIFKMLKEIFVLIDMNKDGVLQVDEVVKFNVFLDPSANLECAYKDARLLFHLSDENKDDEITESEWLNGWTESVLKNGRRENLEVFLRHYQERRIRHEQLVQAWQFTNRMLLRILRWSRKYSHQN